MQRAVGLSELDTEKSKRWRSTLNTVLHKKAGWKPAAKAIMQYGLPKLGRASESAGATEHSNALGQYAADMAKWLKSLARGMYEYRETAEYQRNYKASRLALEKRTSWSSSYWASGYS